MKLSIVIVSFNTRELLKSCLDSLFNNYSNQFENKEYEVIVVDNASVDGSATMMKHTFPEAILITNKYNQGFAKANNLGVKKAQGECILFLNPDTEVPLKTLTVMLDFISQQNNVGIATCKVVLKNGELDDASHRGFPTPWRSLTHFLGLGKLFPASQLFNGYHLGYESMDKPHEIDACAGAFLLIRREVGAKVNWFDEDYFWYGDDLDLCFRVKTLGYKIMFVPQVAILHYKGAASGIKKHSQDVSTADVETRRLSTQARFDVMKIFYRKHYLDKYPTWLTKLVFLGIDMKRKLSEVSV